MCTYEHLPAAVVVRVVYSQAWTNTFNLLAGFRCMTAKIAYSLVLQIYSRKQEACDAGLLLDGQCAGDQLGGSL